MEATVRIAMLVLTALLLTPLAVAGGAHVESTGAPAVAGAYSVHFDEGVAAMTSIDTLEFEISGVTGLAIVYTWSAVAAGDVSVGTRPADEVRLRLDNATIVGRVSQEAYEISLRTLEGGTLSAEGSAPLVPARPDWLQTEWSESALPIEVPIAPPSLSIRAPAGWGAVGEGLRRGHAGFPDGARLVAAGPAEFDMHGGNITILHSNGTQQDLRLSPVVVSEATFRVERQTTLIFQGTIGRLDVPLVDEWIVAGPEPVWVVDGTVDWSRASGEEEGVPFSDQPAHVEGSFTLTPDPSRRDVIEPDRFELSGDYTLTAGGIVLTPKPVAAPAPVAAWTLAGVIAAIFAFLGSPHLAGRIVAPFYTRIARDDIATHPARSLICAQLASAPGVHLRDLHRRIGGAWGTFSFHLGMLRQAGVIRFERDGRYVAVYLAHQQAVSASPRTATAQKVLEALPRDGSRLPVTQLRERVGLSRQLLDHHLAVLAQQQLVVVDDARPRKVARTREEKRA